jgi:hypothetical protein
MKISDGLPIVRVGYEVAESNLPVGRPGRADCAVCGQLLESWQDDKLRSYRLVLSPEHKYRPVTPPASPRNDRLT